MKKLSVSQIAVSNFPYGKYSFGYALDSLERMGGENLELYACDPHFHVDDMTASDLAAAKKQIKDHHLRCASRRNSVFIRLISRIKM